MLRMFQTRSAEAAQKYFTQGLAREDYYLEGQEIPGRWRGRAAERLGLKGPVERNAFVALTENRHPQTGERLTLRHRENRTVAYDLNFHAPKGVSLMHALGGDERILEAFRAAVDETMREIEMDASTRVRKGGAQSDRVTGNLAWSEFIHLTARPAKKTGAPDPHLHAHCFVFNATYDETEDAWKAGQFREIKRDTPYYEAAFHARLADRLHGLGYRTERTATGWDIAGLPRPLIEKYATRTAEIEKVAAELGITDPAAKGELGARTRRAKQNDRAMRDLKTGWRERLTPEEARRIEAARPSRTLPDAGSGEADRRRAASRAVDWAIGHVFERRSSHRLRRLVAEALKAGVGETRVGEVWDEIRRRPLLERRVGRDTLVSTREVLAEAVPL